MFKRLIVNVVLMSFVLSSVSPSSTAWSMDRELVLPAPGTMVHLSSPEHPAMLKGIKVDSNNPFRFEFILDVGDLPAGRQAAQNDSTLQEESTKLIKYFLASLTIPEKDLWVNLSPYEKDRIVPDSFGLTEMGRDLLAQDYMLKQVTASLIYPEDEIGKRFWKRVYEEAAKKYGTTNIPVNTFNKVWIVPEKAVVYENAKAGTAYVVESKLKVMLEQDYLSMEKHSASQGGLSVSEWEDPHRAEGPMRRQASQPVNASSLGSQIVREIVIPELTKEVNEGKNFSQLRQVYNSLILATWYKKKIKDSILSKVYADKNKVQGVNIQDPQEKQKIYQQYLQAFKKGVYNYIKEEPVPGTGERVPRKYFSGGMGFAGRAMSDTIAFSKQRPVEPAPNTVVRVRTDMAMAGDSSVEQDQAVVVNLRETLNQWPQFPRRPKLERGHKDLKSQLIDQMRSVLDRQSSGMGDLSSEQKDRLAMKIVNNIMLLAVNEEHEKIRVMYGDVKSIEQFMNLLVQIRDLNVVDQPRAMEQALTFFQDLLDQLPVQIKDDKERIYKLAMGNESIFQRIRLFQTIFSYLEDLLGISVESLEQLPEAEVKKFYDQLIISAFYVSESLTAAENMQLIVDELTKEGISINQEGASLKKTYLVAIYAVARRAKKDSLVAVIKRLKDEKISWNQAWGEKLKDFYLKMLYQVGMEGKEILLDKIIKRLEDEGIKWHDDWSEELKAEYLIAVYNIVTSKNPDLLDSVIERYKKAGIQWEKGNQSWSDVYNVQYLIAVYAAATRGNLESLDEVIRKYKDIAEVQWNDRWDIKVKLGYLIAVYSVAMKGKAESLENVIVRLRDKGIAWNEGWSDDLKVQYLIAVYQVAKEGKEDSLVKVIDRLADEEIVWDKSWDDNLKIRYLVAVYQIAKEGKEDSLDRVIKKYKKSNPPIAWNKQWSVDLKIGYLNAIYSVARNGKEDSVELVMNRFEQEGITWETMDTDDLKLQYLVAVYSIAMKGREDSLGRVIDILGIRWQNREWSDDVKKQYLRTVYTVSKDGKENILKRVVEEFRGQEITWDSMWAEMIQLEYFKAINQFAVRGKEKLLKEIIAALSLKLNLTVEQKLKLSWRIALVEESRSSILERIRLASVVDVEGLVEELDREIFKKNKDYPDNTIKQTALNNFFGNTDVDYAQTSVEEGDLTSDEAMLAELEGLVQGFSFDGDLGDIRERVTRIEGSLNRLLGQLGISNETVEQERLQSTSLEGGFGQGIVLSRTEDRWGKVVTYPLGILVREHKLRALEKAHIQFESRVTLGQEYETFLAAKIKEELGYLRNLIKQGASSRTREFLIYELATFLELVQAARDRILIRAFTGGNAAEVKDALEKVSLMKNPDQIHLIMSKVLEAKGVVVQYSSSESGIADQEAFVVSLQRGQSLLGEFRYVIDGHVIQITSIDSRMMDQEYGPIVYLWWATQPDSRHDLYGMMIQNKAATEKMGALESAGIFSVVGHQADIGGDRWEYTAHFPEWEKEQPTEKEQALLLSAQGVEHDLNNRLTFVNFQELFFMSGGFEELQSLVNSLSKNILNALDKPSSFKDWSVRQKVRFYKRAFVKISRYFAMLKNLWGEPMDSQVGLMKGRQEKDLKIIREGVEAALSFMEKRNVKMERSQGDLYGSPDKEMVPLRKIVSSVFGLLRVQTKAQLLYDKGDLKDDQVYVDVEQWTDIILNLVKNATHAVEGKGAEGVVRVVLEKKSESELGIKVIDNGAGMPEAVRNRIWEPFFTTKGNRGTGLGLPNCKRMIEDHGGKISVNSQEGIGTIFTIVLPSKKEEVVSRVVEPVILSDGQVQILAEQIGERMNEAQIDWKLLVRFLELSSFLLALREYLFEGGYQHKLDKEIWEYFSPVQDILKVKEQAWTENQVDQFINMVQATINYLKEKEQVRIATLIFENIQTSALAEKLKAFRGFRGKANTFDDGIVPAIVESVIKDHLESWMDEDFQAETLDRVERMLEGDMAMTGVSVKKEGTDTVFDLKDPIPLDRNGNVVLKRLVISRDQKTWSATLINNDYKERDKDGRVKKSVSKEYNITMGIRSSNEYRFEYRYRGELVWLLDKKVSLSSYVSTGRKRYTGKSVGFEFFTNPSKSEKVGHHDVDIEVANHLVRSGFIKMEVQFEGQGYATIINAMRKVYFIAQRFSDFDILSGYKLTDGEFGPDETRSKAAFLAVFYEKNKWSYKLVSDSDYQYVLTHVGGDSRALEVVEYMMNRLKGAEKVSAPAADEAMEAGVDRAMSNTGGIDLTADKTPLEVKNSGEAIKFQLDPVLFKQLQGAKGFVPVIIDILPMYNLGEFLGSNEAVPAANVV